MQAVAGSLPELRSELSSLDRRLTVLAHILPEEYETADLLRGVGTLAAQSNLNIRDLEFRDPVPYEFYAESPIELELTGHLSRSGAVLRSHRKVRSHHQRRRGSPSRRSTPRMHLSRQP